MQTDRLVYFVYKNIDMKHLAEKIKELMAAFSRNHYEYMMFEEYGMPDFLNCPKKNVLIMKWTNKKERIP